MVAALASDPFGLEYGEKLLDEFLVARMGVINGEIPTAYAGVYNRGGINATNRPIPFVDGGLIILDAGLLTFAYLACKAICEGTSAIELPQSADSQPSVMYIEDAPSGSKIHDPALTTNELNEYLFELLEAVASGNARACRRLPYTKRLSVISSEYFANSYARFTIAHEIGHLISRNEEIPLIVESPHKFTELQKEEFRCDMFAVWCEIEHYKKANEKTTNYELLHRLKTGLIAPMVIFRLMHYLNMYKAIKNGSFLITYKEHPPDIFRIDFLLFMLERDNCLQEISEPLALFNQHLDNFHNYLLEKMKESTGQDEINLGVKFTV